MFIGFDYGTSNCAVAVMEQGSPRLLNLGASRYLPSTLHAPHRDAIAGLLAEGLAPAQQAEYLKLRGPVVTRAQMVRRQMREEARRSVPCSPTRDNPPTPSPPSRRRCWT